MPHSPCSTPTCPEYATYRGYCPIHAKQREPKRKGKKVYNSKRWKILRRKMLARDYLCEQCVAEGQDYPRAAVDIHHRHGVEVDPWSMGGLQALCKQHHGRITKAETNGIGWPE